MTNNIVTPIQFNVTQDVRNMVDGTYINNGWVFRVNKSKQNNWSKEQTVDWTFYSMEVTGEAKKPKLVITYDVPPPPVVPITELSFSTTHATYLGANDGTANITVEGGSGNYAYAWSGGVANGNSVSGLLAGDYSVTVTDESDNSNSLFKEFTINEGPDNTPDMGGILISKDGTAKSDESSILHVQSTDKGVLIPRMSSDERLDIPNKVTPANGLLVYDNEINKFFYLL